MAKNSVSSLLSVDDLFTTQTERDESKHEKVIDIPIKAIHDFPNHPFKVRMDDSMVEMVKSIKQYGVLVPALVRSKSDGTYEMVAGHRRKAASELAEAPTLSCIVRELTDEEATIIMVDSNLQREKILPSEKAFAYKMKLEAIKKQGNRTDLTSDPVGQKLKGVISVEKIAIDSPDSKTQIQRFIRLTNLIPELLDMVDEDKIAMRPAVELSYLTENEQKMLFDAMECEDCTPSHAQAIKLREASQKGLLTEDKILSVMEQEKPNQIEQFKMPKDRISKYFPVGTPAKKIEDTIVKALEYYRRRNRERER